MSGRAETVLGYPVDRWLREPDFWARRIHPEDRESTLEFYRDALKHMPPDAAVYSSLGDDVRADAGRVLVRAGSL